MHDSLTACLCYRYAFRPVGAYIFQVYSWNICSKRCIFFWYAYRTVGAVLPTHRSAHNQQFFIHDTRQRRGMHSSSQPSHFRYFADRHFATQHMYRVGQNRIYTPYMTVYSVISLPKIPHMHRIYMVLANPTHVST